MSTSTDEALSSTTKPVNPRKRPGASQRLAQAMDQKAWDASNAIRRVKLMEDLALSESTAQQMLTADYVPNDPVTLDAVYELLALPRAYWEFGIDAFIEYTVLNTFKVALKAVLKEYSQRGQDLNDVPLGNIVMMTQNVYSAAIANADDQFAIDYDKVKELVSISISALSVANTDELMDGPTP